MILGLKDGNSEGKKKKKHHKQIFVNLGFPCFCVCDFIVVFDLNIHCAMREKKKWLN